MSSQTPPTFDKPRHIKFWKRCATLLPQDYTSSDASRLSLGFFIVAALDLLGALETEIPTAERNSWIDWIYACQVASGGFRGFPGTNLGSYRNIWNMQWDPASVPSTYLALLTLLILGDDLGRVKRKGCLQWMGRLQRRNGSFGEFEGEDGEVMGKDDLRTCYCAVGVAYILQKGLVEELPFEEKALLRFIANCQHHDGGFGQSPLLEAHSGLNFCAMAALECLNRLNSDHEDGESGTKFKSLDLDHNVEWMLQRQTTWVDDDNSSDEEDEDPSEQHLNGIDGASTATPPTMGFNGRLGKMADTCYCFWNLGALTVVNSESPVEVDSLRRYLCGKTQHVIGGFSKAPGAPPDVMHSYLGLAALALQEGTGLKGLDPVLAVSKDATRNLEKVAWTKKDST
jgi:geranylgeranyl transferase type-1 subunit beta